MTVYTLDPLSDPRWAEFVNRHDSASVFHSVPWLQAIQRTYGYTPVVFTTSPPSSPLSNGVVICQIKSWLTGRRMVSLPFSDHCEPLLDGSDAGNEIAEELKKKVDKGTWKYIELRPMSDMSALEGVVKTPACFFHMLDLTPSADELLKQTHKNSIQQPIKKAEKEGLVYESGNSERLLDAFYLLMIQTRRKHQLPPQPIQWFRNLAAAMGDRLQIRVAFKGEVPITSILTMVHKNVIVYKYGCSDSNYNNLGGTPFLLWKTIQEARAAGLTLMDFGRSDADNEGLVTFKRRWGAKASELVYLRWSKKQSKAASPGYSSDLAKRLFAMMPDSVLAATGRLLYRHMA